MNEYSCYDSFESADYAAFITKIIKAPVASGAEIYKLVAAEK